MSRNCKHIKYLTERVDKLEKQLFTTNRRLMVVEQELKLNRIKNKKPVELLMKPPIRREIP